MTFLVTAHQDLAPLMGLSRVGRDTIAPCRHLDSMPIHALPALTPTAAPSTKHLSVLTVTLDTTVQVISYLTKNTKVS